MFLRIILYDMTEENVNEKIIAVLDEVKHNIKERDDRIRESLEDIYDEDDVSPDYMMGKSSGHLSAAVEINKKKQELMEE